MERIKYRPEKGSGYDALAKFLVTHSKNSQIQSCWIKKNENLTRLSTAIKIRLKEENIELHANAEISVIAELSYYLPELKPNMASLHVAWTVDDGPTRFTQQMANNFLLNGQNRPATWFIVRDRLTSDKTGFYKYLQNKGHEIAIHGLHKKDNHLSWLPSGSLASYKNLSTALQDLEKFQRELQNRGLHARFVRLPYGLFTELIHSLKVKGMKKSQATAARNIIKAKISITGTAPENRVAKEFDILRSKLKDLGLILWGGRNNGGISANSWQYESASKETVRGKDDFDIEKGNKVYNKIHNIRKKNKSDSMVILCHDTTGGDVIEVRKDLLSMENTAAKAGICIKYHTMSSLYKQITS
ncbi:hypothetical protein MNBD_GAMMA11-1183 [hydrothermal vent metagenome]|uniref:NodB homology domain-containing protein n=1 Tax=hydrothermal vent metagenome TaxID=652676 RepID=A0A3B0XUU6_9ZZZZ